MKRDAIDLGALDVGALFRRYFFPTLLGMLSMSAVTALDGVFVGHGIGSDGIAAVNICIPLLMFFTGVGLMAGAGASVVASIQLSRGKERIARINVTQAFGLVTIVGIGAWGLMAAFPVQTARLLGASEHLAPMVREYLLWFLPLLLFQMWCSVSLLVIRLDGAPRFAMLCNVVAAAMTTLLGWLFVFPLDLGLMGAAFAGTLGVFAGGVMGLAYLLFFARRLRLCRLKWSAKSLRLAVRNLGYQCRVGSSALLTEATLAVLMFMGNWAFMRYLGDDGVGAFGIACYYLPFVFMIGNAVAQSAQPIISYNYGLGRQGRVARTERIALVTAVICGLVSTAAFMFLPRELVGLFIDTENAAARLAIGGFPYFAVAFVFFIFNLTVIGYYQSVERMKPATGLALLRGFVFLALSFMLLPKFAGEKGLWLALAAAECLTTAVIAVMFIARRWQRRT